MTEILSAMIKKYGDILLYIIFGLFTTAVNQVSFMALMRLLPDSSTIVPNLAAWIISVSVAYITNRTWVFRSRARGPAALVRELASFFGARVFSGLLDMAAVFLASDLLGYPADIVKLLSNIFIVVGLNYLLSKFWVFKQGKISDGEN